MSWKDPAPVHAVAAGMSGLEYIRAIFEGRLPLRCKGTVISRGRRVVTAEGRLIAERPGKVLAHGTTTCLIEQPN